MLHALARNWWALVLRGIAAIIFALLAFLMPGVTIFVLVTLFGIYALVDGVVNLVAVFRTGIKEHWPLLIEAVLGMVAGILTLIWPHITALDPDLVNWLLGDFHRNLRNRRGGPALARCGPGMAAAALWNRFGGLWIFCSVRACRRCAGCCYLDSRLCADFRHSAGRLWFSAAKVGAEATGGGLDRSGRLREREGFYRL